MRELEGENYEKACQAHPEKYQDISSAINQMGDEWNPRLHLILHSVVLNHKEASKPVQEAFEKLTEEFNLHHHSAIHALSAVLNEEIFTMLKERREFDPESQKEELDKLLDPNSEQHKNYVEPLKDGKPPKHPEIN